MKQTVGKLMMSNADLKRPISGLKLTEDTLRKSEKKYRTLLENLPQKIFHKDVHSVYVSCNQNFAQDLAIRPEDIAGKTDYDFFPRDLAKKYVADDKRVIKTGAVKSVEERYVQNGKKIIVQTVKAPIKDKRERVIGILGIFWDITDRKRMQEKINCYQKDLRALSVQLTSTEERERRQFASFLHDRIGQLLVFLKIKMEIFAQSYKLNESDKVVGELIDIINQLIANTRSLIYEMSPTILYQLGLSAALESIVEQMNTFAGTAFTFQDDGSAKPLDNNSSIFLYRAVYELLVNIVKHAKAQTAHVSFKKYKNHACISVQDDGTGFNATKRQAAKKAGAGYGLFSISERLEQLGGSIHIRSKPGHGVRVDLSVPLSATDKP